MSDVQCIARNSPVTICAIKQIPRSEPKFQEFQKEALTWKTFLKFLKFFFKFLKGVSVHFLNYIIKDYSPKIGEVRFSKSHNQNPKSNFSNLGT